MRIHSKLGLSVAAGALLAGTALVVPAGAGLVEEPVTTVTSVTLACTSEPDFSQFTGPLSFGLTASVTLPEFGDQDEVVDFDADYELTLPSGLATLATNAGVTELAISNLVMNTGASGGISGGPFAAAPTAFNIVVAEGSATVSASGSVTVTDASQVGLLSIVDPVTFLTTVQIPDADPLTLAVTCTSNDADVAAINGSIPETTTTTAAPTTTTAAPAEVAATPRFTG